MFWWTNLKNLPGFGDCVPIMLNVGLLQNISVLIVQILPDRNEQMLAEYYAQMVHVT